MLEFLQNQQILPPVATIDATVVDGENNPVIWANVFLESKPEQGVITNDQGYFKLANIPLDEIIMISYQGTVKKYQAAQLPKRVVLATESLPEVVITAKPNHKWKWWLLATGLTLSFVSILADGSNSVKTANVTL